MIENASKHPNHSRNNQVNSLSPMFSTGGATQHKINNNIQNFQIKITTRPFGGAAILVCFRETEEEKRLFTATKWGGSEHTDKWRIA